MWNCKFCGAQNTDVSIQCSVCFKHRISHGECPVCGKETDGNRTCGSPQCEIELSRGG
jgi:hypothetical protein